MGGGSAHRRNDGSTGRRSAEPPNRRTDLPRSGRLLCIDPGSKRIGLALSDPTQTVAQPLATLTRRVGRRFPLAALRPYLDAYRPVGFVIGLPLDPAGGEGPAARAARSAGALLEKKTGLPVAFADERLSTAHALRAARGAPRRAQPSRDAVDQMAATVILQAFLDRRCA
jgi:putative Holliday junction resolvase